MRISDWSSDVCSSDLSSGQSWSMTSYCPVPGVGPESPSDHDYAGGFATALMLKDLRLAIEAAASVDSDPPIGAQARDLYEASAAAGRYGESHVGKGCVSTGRLRWRAYHLKNQDNYTPPK